MWLGLLDKAVASNRLSVLWGLYLNLFALLKPGCGRIKMMIFLFTKRYLSQELQKMEVKGKP